MTATLIARGLAATHGDRSLFTGLDLVVAPGDVVGLVGANGAGKSTLLGLLAGHGAPAAGTVTLSPPDAAVGWLRQEVERRAGEDVAAHLARRTGVSGAQRALDAATTALSDSPPGAPGVADAYAAAFDRWLALGAADLVDRTGAVMAEVGLTGVPGGTGALMTDLSGGQAARVGLGALLLSRFDVLLLDEPTNDLDLDGLDRFEAFVAAQRAGVVVVSHDREFLTRTVTSVVELDLAQHKVGVYGGGYEAYLAERARARDHAREQYDEYAGTRAGLEERARTQRAWLDKGVRGAIKKSSDPDKVLRGKRRESTEKQAAKARQTQRRIERLDVVDEPRKEWDLQYAIAAAPGGSQVVATLRAARLTRGGARGTGDGDRGAGFTLGPLDAHVEAGDRIGITGPNGAGKTTLLALLLGRLQPTAGSATLGASVAVGEVDQARRSLAAPRGAPGGPTGAGVPSLLDAVRDRLPDAPPDEVRTLLAKFGLRGDAVLRPVESMSPGERTRAAMALLQARGVNLLVLDEPTNHLDLPAIEQLEVALEAYRGTLLLVSHDRRLLEAVRLTRRWHVEGGRLTQR